MLMIVDAFFNPTAGRIVLHRSWPPRAGNVHVSTAATPPATGVGPVAATRARQPLYWWRGIRPSKELHRKYLLLVMVGCGGPVAAQNNDSKSAVGRLRFVALCGNLY
jgi:hypothetical protein